MFFEGLAAQRVSLQVHGLTSHQGLLRFGFQALRRY
jgi:hypothetical protein